MFNCFFKSKLGNYIKSENKENLQFNETMYLDRNPLRSFKKSDLQLK